MSIVVELYARSETYLFQEGRYDANLFLRLQIRINVNSRAFIRRLSGV